MILLPICCIAFLGAPSLRDRPVGGDSGDSQANHRLHGVLESQNTRNWPLYYGAGVKRLRDGGAPAVGDAFRGERASGAHVRSRSWFRCAGVASPDSVFREPMPGEVITLPNPSAPTGQYLLDKELIDKVAELRTFIEDVEVSRGKRSQLRLLERELNKDKCQIVHLTEEEAARLGEPSGSEADEPGPEERETPMEINEATLEPIKDHMYEENLLEEVLGKAFSVYRKNRDQEGIRRLERIAGEIAPIAEKVRKSRAEDIIIRLINCYVEDEENVDDVLEELQKQKQLNKYLMQRFDELIKLASQKFRISDKHPAASEQFLRAVKDRVAAQVITHYRGTARWVRILAECFRYDNCVDYEAVLKRSLRKIEDIEDFRDWLLDGIDYCRQMGRMENRIEAMESIDSIVVGMHPVWTPRDDHVETEDIPYDLPMPPNDVLADV
ncbi:uncharacterized protein BcabD6B2_09130 [Babesia caballi]|uniref:Uncharacterized protein n=1 Tax=Babesia caballi TaxID=5871 RepID=A0AAV4LNJ8_BABCB|nr:hypothetical protein, conserved [Babesia caballi]